MELWIRSQDRTVLRKVNTIGIVEGRDFWSIDENLTVSFGKYKTKERAIEVLDEIEKLIKPIIIFQNCQVDKSIIEKIKEIGCCMVNDDARVEQISQAFYQMPEE